MTNSWKNTPTREWVCIMCGAQFLAKRSAKFCSPLCYGRSRPRRRRNKERENELRRIRLLEPEYRRRLNKYQNDRAIAIRRWLDAYKLERGCVDCGYKRHHAALHFDHVMGMKSLNVSNAKSLAAAQEEMKKCEVRCANCHFERTFKKYVE